MTHLIWLVYKIHFHLHNSECMQSEENQDWCCFLILRTILLEAWLTFSLFCSGISRYFRLGKKWGSCVKPNKLINRLQPAHRWHPSNTDPESLCCWWWPTILVNSVLLFFFLSIFQKLLQHILKLLIKTLLGTMEEVCKFKAIIKDCRKLQIRSDKLMIWDNNGLVIKVLKVLWG